MTLLLIIGEIGRIRLFLTYIFSNIGVKNAHSP